VIARFLLFYGPLNKKKRGERRRKHLKKGEQLTCAIVLRSKLDLLDA
jgi:hypothetical protein